MTGIEFISPGSPSSEELLRRLLPTDVELPKPLASQDKLSGYLWDAIWHPATELSVMDHVNLRTSKPFSCVSYYAEEFFQAATCQKIGDSYVAVLGVPFVRQLLGICHRLAPALALRPRTGPRRQEPKVVLNRDEELGKLMEDLTSISEAEKEAALSSWPSSKKANAQTELGEYTVFYDVLRVVWLHEWAHALCGHVAFGSSTLGLMRFNEFSTERAGDQPVGDLPFSRSEIMQALEMHADEFATRYCVRSILWGYDPIGELAGPVIDLVDRLLLFNVAACVFAVLWSLSDERYAPGDTYVAPRLPLTTPDSIPDPLYKLTKSTHPPAVLRYERIRNLQRDLAVKYSRETSTSLSVSVDSFSYAFLERLTQLSKAFGPVIAVTPFAFKTPDEKRLAAYEAHLLRIGAALAPHLERLNYVPTVDPYRSE